MRRGFEWLKWILFTGGVAMLAWCGFVLVDTWMFQNRERHDLERALADRHDSGRAIAPISIKNSPAAIDGMIGRMEISRLGLSTMVMEGTTQTILRRAAGHIAGTPLPGETGNIGISGHRDTFFRPLRNIRHNDIITLVTVGGEYRYRVVFTKIVGPRDVGVLAATPNEVLTLVTCYPFYFVGPAPYRFIVRAIRVGNSS